MRLTVAQTLAGTTGRNSHSVLSMWPGHPHSGMPGLEGPVSRERVSKTVSAFLTLPLKLCGITSTGLYSLDAVSQARHMQGKGNWTLPLDGGNIKDFADITKTAMPTSPWCDTSVSGLMSDSTWENLPICFSNIASLSFLCSLPLEFLWRYVGALVDHFVSQWYLHIFYLFSSPCYVLN